MALQRIKSSHKWLWAATVIAATLTSTKVFGQSLAITNATLYTGTEQGVIEQATLVFEDGVITAINPEVLEADETLDVQGKIVTPGFIGSLNRLGLIEVEAVGESEDDELEKPELSFTPARAFNPQSTVIPLARSGGVTRNLIIPANGETPFAGVASIVSLDGKLGPIDTRPAAAVVYLYGSQAQSRAHRLDEIYDALAKRQADVAKANSKTEKEPEDYSVTNQRLDALLAGNLPLLVITHRPADIYQALALQDTFGLKLIIGGGAGAVAAKEALAKAKVPVILDPMQNLPQSFDELYADQSNATELSQAGVPIILAVLSDSTHQLFQLRFGAGNAIASGLAPQAALAALTTTPAEVFGLNSGQLAPGKVADIAVWQGDPFDVSGFLEQLWIGGQSTSTETRQDKLRDRYLTPTSLPPAYRY